MSTAIHIINGDHFAGAERVQDLLSSALPDLGWVVEFAQLKPGLFSEKRDSCSNLYSFPMRSRIDILFIFPLLKLVKEKRYSVIHAHTPRSLLISVIISIFSGIPLVYHFHSPASQCSSSKWKNWLNSKLERIVLPCFVDHVIAVSAAMMPYIKSAGVSEDKVTLALNGVKVRSERVDFHGSHSGFKFVCVALFRERKGVDILIKAFAQAKLASSVPLSLALIGLFESDAYKDHVVGLIDSLGLRSDVVLEGFCDDVSRRIIDAHCLILPSLRGEGLPMVILEAMAVGLPVIASDVEGAGEAVINDETGYLVLPGDPVELSAAMVKVSTVPGSTLKKMSEAAADLQQTRFSDMSMAKKVADVYAKITEH